MIPVNDIKNSSKNYYLFAINPKLLKKQAKLIIYSIKF